MSLYVMVAVLDAEGLTPSEKIVAIAYADHAHHDGTEARAGLDRIAMKSSLSRRTVNVTIKSLLEKRVMIVQRPATNRTPVCYQFLLTNDGKSLLHFRHAETAPQTSRGAVDDARGAVDDTLGCSHCTLTVSKPSNEPLTPLFDKVEPSAERRAYSAEFEKVWDIYPKKRLKGDAYKSFVARLRSGVTFSQLEEATTNYASARAGEDQQFTVDGKRFFGPDYWREYLSPSLAGIDDKAESARRAARELEDRRAREHAISKPMPDSVKAIVKRMRGNL